MGICISSFKGTLVSDAKKQVLFRFYFSETISSNILKKKKKKFVKNVFIHVWTSYYRHCFITFNSE